MSQVDWSKAPEGYDVHINWSYDQAFYKIERDRYVRDGGRYADIKETHAFEGVVVTFRPWTGTGLPHVGCLVKADRYANPARVLYSSEQIVIVCSDFNEEYALKPNQVYPIRTPEQIAAEEREKAIQQMIEACPYPGSRSTAIDCTALYDAGWRKADAP